MPARNASTRPWYSSFWASVLAVARLASASASPLRATSAWPFTYFLKSVIFLATAAFAFCGVTWMLLMYSTRSSTAWTFFGPPPATPHAGIGVPGRP